MVGSLTAAGDHHFDAAYTVDGLNRVTGAREGHWDGTQITTGNRRREQLWTLNQVGDQALDQLDLNGDGDQGDTVNSITELNDTRTYSDANELKTRDINSSAPAEYSLGYDKAGNRIDDGTYDYVYDAWYRLVKVKTQAGATVCEYRYNGLRYRVSWRYDNSQSGAYGPDGTVDGNDKTFHFAYDTRWRPVATYRESDSDPKEQLVYHNAGFGGKGSSSYIDSVLLRDKDANAQAGSPPADTFAWDEATDGTLEQRYYYCQNWRGDVVAIVKSDGSQVVEWVKYLAYGRPDLHPFGDSDQDGAMLPADGGAYNSMYLSAQTTYFVRADTNLSGTITSADLTANSVDLNSWPNAGIDQLSRTDTTFNVGNRIGYAGMQWDPVIKKYLARVRWLGAGTGTWTQRDALGYIDGLSLYQYVGSSPVGFGDPMGLSPVQPCVEWAPELVEPLPGQPLSYTGEAVDSAEWQYNININNPIPFGSPLGLTGTVSARLALKQTERGSNSTFHFDATTTCSMQGSINTPLGAIPIPGFGITLMSTRTYGDWRIRCFGPHPEQILIGKDLVDTASGIFGNLEQTSDVAWSHFAGGNMEYLKAEATTNSAWTLPPVTINFSVSGKPFGIGAELSVSMEIHGSLRESISLTTWVWTCGCVRLGRPDTADPITQP